MADEVYYFKRNYKPQKETSAVQVPQVVEPTIPSTPMMDVDNEDSMDAPSVGSTEGIATPLISTPVQKKVCFLQGIIVRYPYPTMFLVSHLMKSCCE